MTRKLRDHLTYANVVATLALLIAIGGGAAYAANTVFSSDIVDGEVYSADVRNDTLAGGGLTAADLRPGSVGGSEITRDAVRTSEVRDNDLTGADIDESALNGAGDVSGPLSNLQLGYGSVGRDELSGGSGPGCCQTFPMPFGGLTIAANSCHIQAQSFPQADVGEIFLAIPEADLGSGVYLRPTVVAHAGEAQYEFCNNGGSAVTIPFSTSFTVRLIG